MLFKIVSSFELGQ